MADGRTADHRAADSCRLGWLRGGEAVRRDAEGIRASVASCAVGRLMPLATYCLKHGLSEGAGRCRDCKRERSRERNSRPAHKVWNSPEWRRIRKAALDRDGHRCRYLGEDGQRCTRPNGSRSTTSLRSVKAGRDLTSGTSRRFAIVTTVRLIGAVRWRTRRGRREGAFGGVQVPTPALRRSAPRRPTWGTGSPECRCRTVRYASARERPPQAASTSS
jgi:hypothetical protein